MPRPPSPDDRRPPDPGVPRGPSGNGHPRRWATTGALPKWIVESLSRVTPQDRIPEVVSRLERAAAAFAEGRHEVALREAEAAKGLSPREATIRELIGLSAYRLGRWEQGLRELRAFRRLTGEPTHVPVELDLLRALDRPKDVTDLWRRLGGMDAYPETRNEARVVYASFLLDRGDARGAWEVSDPKRIGDDPEESELRVWYVAALAAYALGDEGTAGRLREAIEAADPAFPGLDDLARTLG